MKKILTLAAMMLLSVMGLSACTAKTNKANGRSSESHQARSDGRVVTDEGEVNQDRPAVVWTDEMLSKEEYERLPTDTPQTVHEVKGIEM